MARAEKSPIVIPDGVSMEIQGNQVTVKGAKGHLENAFPADVALSLEKDRLFLRATNEMRRARALVGTVKALIINMIRGVTKGFSKQLEISGVGFKAALKGSNVLDLALGTSHPIHYPLPDGIQITIAEGVKVTVSGIDKQKVGQVAADIFAFYPMEPYKGKGVCIVGKFVRRKEGKKTA
jgi:large subunit ribosomal protein L6